MAVVQNVLGTYNELTINLNADVSLAALQYCAVTSTSAASGKSEAAKVSGQGGIALGILQNAPAANEQAEIMHAGISKVCAYSTFNCGAELTPHDTGGKLETAAAADYVVAIALEASTCGDAIVPALLVTPYQKNA